MTEEDCQRSTFINFCKQMFFDVSTQRQIAAYRKQEIEESGATDDTRGMGTEIPLLEVDYHVFPESYHFINGFSSDSHPVFDSVVGSVLKEKSEHELTTEYQGKTHIPLKIQALRALSNHSLKELSIDPDCRDIYREALRLKSDYFFAYFPQKYGIARNTFETVLCDFLKEHRFETVGFDTFDTTVEERFGVRMESDFKRWYEDVAMPYYEAYDFKYHKIIHDGSEKYQVYFSVYNRSKYDGVFSAMMYSDKDGHCENLFYIGGNEARQFGMLMSGPPTYGLRIDPLVSRHYWFIDNYLDRYEGDLNAAPFEGSRVIDAPIPAYDEIIVDNLDPGFQIVSQPPVSIVKRLLSGKGRDTGNDFKPLDVNAIPGRWSYCFEEQFYGKPEPSAFYIRPGKGDYSVSFTADITEPGKYHIFFYSPQRLVGMRVSTDSYHFRVYHENLVDEASISMEKLEDAWANINNYHLKGWIPLGTYVFTKGPAKVELTDKSDALYVFADAVKWVKQ